MALSKDYIGKKCYIDMEDNPNIDKSMLGTIINYYSDGSDTYVEVSMNPYGEVIKVRDDSLITIIDSGSGGGGGGGGGDTPPYPPLPSDYQELEYLTSPANVWPRINTGSSPNIAGDIYRFDIRGVGTPIGKRYSGWNAGVDVISTLGCSGWNSTKVYQSWDYLSQQPGDWCSVAFTCNYAGEFDYGSWGPPTGPSGDHYTGDLGKLLVERRIVIGGNTYDKLDLAIKVVMALIPCYRKSDGANGFYDTVNDVFYTAVNGAFTRGPEKN